jgi:hypothetical protein
MFCSENNAELNLTISINVMTLVKEEKESRQKKEGVDLSWY